MKLIFLVTTIALLFSACSTASPEAHQPEFKPWSEVTASDSQSRGIGYDDPQLIGSVTDPRLSEISGIAASRQNPGVLWVHNDSGDQARIYALDYSGKLLAQYDVAGSRNIDWEDIALLPSGNQSYILLADIGDNSRTRGNAVIYKIREPRLKVDLKAGPAEAFPFSYPDGKHDCEALFVNPANGQIFLITKTISQNCAVYRFPLPMQPNRKVTVERVTGREIASIEQLRMVTAAATSPDGLRVIIRTYFGAFELSREKGTSFESLFETKPSTIRMPMMRQAEAICYSPDGRSLITTSEKLPAPLYRLTRR